MEAFKEQLLKLNNLNLSEREALMDLSKYDEKRMFSYFKSAYDDEMTKIVTPLITNDFIDVTIWESIPEYSNDEPLDITEIWKMVLNCLKSIHADLKSVIIDRDYSVIDN